MPIVLLLLGIVLVIAGWRGKENELFSIIKNALFPSNLNIKNNFLVWAGAIFFIGIFGYIKSIRPIVIGIIILIYIVLIISMNKQGELKNLLNLNQLRLKGENKNG